MDAAIASLVDEMGGIDVLLNNAGGGCTKGPLHEQSAAGFRALLELNVVSVLVVSSNPNLPLPRTAILFLVLALALALPQALALAPPPTPTPYPYPYPYTYTYP